MNKIRKILERLKHTIRPILTLSMGLICLTSVKAAEVAYLNTPPGLFVLFDTHRLYYYCRGSGEPTVLIDGGIGDASANWLGIQEQVARKTRVCVYDRAGYGMSDAGPAPRSTSIIVKELQELLQLAKIAPPYIIVGQSFGGFTAQLFARVFPQQTVGIVLVESSHPEQIKKLAALDEMDKSERDLVTGHDPDLSDELTSWQRQWNMLNSRRKAIFTQMEELRYFANSAKEVETAGPVNAIPVVVLTREVPLLPGLADGTSMEQAWLDMQKKFVNSHPYSKQYVIKGAGHNIHMEQPDKVADAINELLAKLTITPQKQ